MNANLTRERDDGVRIDRRRYSRDEIEVDAVVERTVAESGGHGSDAGHGDLLVRSVDDHDSSHELHFEGGRKRAEQGGAENVDHDLASAMHRAPRSTLQ